MSPKISSNITKYLLALGFLLSVMIITLASVSMAAAPERTGAWANAVSPPTSPSSPELDFTPLGHFGGWIIDVAVPAGDGHTIYLAEGSGFIALDVSNPGQMRETASLSLPGLGDVTDVAVVGSRAYALQGQSLRVIDVADPQHPSLLGSYEGFQNGAGLDVVGNVAYVGDSFAKKLYAIDVSNPISPTLLGEASARGTPVDIQVVGNTAYMAESGYPINGLRIFDVTDPAHPQKLGDFAMQDYRTPVHDLSVAENQVYLANDENGLVVVDVSNPANPAQVAAYDTPGRANGVQVAGATAYLADGDNGLLILNVSNPAHPAVIGGVSDGWAAYGVAVAGDKAYVRGSGNSLRAIDVSDPAHPAVAGMFERPQEVIDMGVDATATYGYISDLKRLWVVRLDQYSDRPVPVGYCDFATFSEDGRVFVAGTRVYVARGRQGLAVVDVSDPAHPALLGTYTPPDSASVRDVFVVGNVAYLMAGKLRIVDLSDVAAPVEKSVWDTPGDARRVFVADHIAYIADGTAGLRLVDVSDPAHPAEVGHVDPPASADKTTVVAVADHVAYVGSNNASDPWGYWVQALDVSDPAHPTVAATHQAAGHVTEMQALGDYVWLYVAGGSVHALHKGGLRQAGTWHVVGNSLRVYFRGWTLVIVHVIKISFGSEYASVEMGPLPTPTPTPPPTHTPTPWPSATPRPKCYVESKVQPLAARNAGCSAEPVRQECQCGTEEVTFSASEKGGWQLESWDPSDTLTCPEQGTKTTIAKFAPFATLAGGSTRYLCGSSEQENVRVLRFTITASEADDWEISSFTIQASGNGDDAKDIKTVRLYNRGKEIGRGRFPSDNGVIRFQFSTIVIPKTKTESFSVVYDFESQDCEGDSKEYILTVLPDDLEAKTYPPGIWEGIANGEVTLGCVLHEDPARPGEGMAAFKHIQEAVNAAKEGTTILVCPGNYYENVGVGKSVAIRSFGGHEITTVWAADPGEHVFAVSANDVTIQDLSIRGAAAAGKAGVYVHGSVIQNATIFNNVITGNRRGVYLQETRRAQVKGNIIFDNTEFGLQAVNASESQIMNNAFRLNGQDGLYLEDCQDATAQGTTITGNNIGQNRGNGVHLKHCRGVSIENNSSIQENNQDGILVEGSTDITINNNPLIRYNGQNGVHLRNCLLNPGQTPILITGNGITGDAQRQPHGIFLENSRGVHIGETARGNTIRYHHGAGVYVLNSQGGTAEGLRNRIVGNTLKYNENGLRLKNACGTLIGGNNTFGPGNTQGIAVEDSHCPATNPNQIANNASISGNETGVALKHACGARIDHETVQQNSQQGVLVIDSDCANEQPNQIAETSFQENGAGLAVKHSANTDVRTCTFERNTDGILVQGGNGRNTIQSNTFSKNTQGVHIDGAGNALVGSGDAADTGNRNTFDGNSTGVLVEHTNTGSPNLIQFNDIRRNRVGVSVRNGSGTMVGPGNLIASQVEHGIYNDGGGLNTIEGNTITSNPIGIFLHRTLGENVFDNDITSNGTGIALNQAMQSHIGEEQKGNTLTHNTFAIYLEEAHQNVIDENTIDSNQGDGIWLKLANGNTISYNDIAKNQGKGISLEGSDENVLQSNHIHRNDREGVKLFMSNTNQIGGCVIQNNGYYGLYLEESDSNQAPPKGMKRNWLEGNVEVGVFVEKSNYNTFRENVVRKTSGDGVRIHDGQWNSLSGAFTIEENSGHGISVKNADNTRVMGAGMLFFQPGAYDTFIRSNGGDAVRFDHSNGGEVQYLRIENNPGAAIRYIASSNHVGHLIYAPHNGDGIEGNDGTNSCTKCRINYSVSSETGIHLHHASLDLTGAVIKGNNGSGIVLEDGSNVTLHKASILDNVGYGLENRDPSVTIDATDNWWGDSSGPGGIGPGSGDEITGTVAYAGWRTAPVALVITEAQDPLYAARGTTSVNTAHIENQQVPTDTVRVTLTDAQGWLASPTASTLNLAEQATIPISVTLPADASLGMTDMVTVTATSEADPNITDVTTFQVIAAALADLEIAKEPARAFVQRTKDLTYTITVTNAGPDEATNVTVTETLPMSLTFQMAAADQGDCAEQHGVVVCHLGTLANGAHVGISVTVQGAGVSGVTTEAEVAASERDPNGANNLAVARVFIQPLVQYLPLMMGSQESAQNSGVLSPRPASIRPPSPLPSVTRCAGSTRTRWRTPCAAAVLFPRAGICRW